MEKTIEEFKNIVLKLHKAGSRNSILLLGQPGIGKTEGVKQACKLIAEDMGKEFIEYDDGVLDKIVAEPVKYYVFVDFSLTTTEPSDLVGLPRDVNNHVVYKQLGWGKALSCSAGCLFLDELTNVQRMDVQSVMLKILLEHLVGFNRLNDDVTVIAAGNKTGKLVTTLPEPILAGRIVKLDIRPPKLDEWIEHMNGKYGDNYDKRIVIFLKKFPERFIEEIKDEDVETYTMFASPRSWTKLSAMSHKLDRETLEPVSEGLVGRCASLFMSFIDIKVPELRELKENLKLWESMSVDQKYFMTLELCNTEAKDIFGKYATVMEMLSKEDREFLMLSFMMMNLAKRKQIALEARLKYPNVFQILLKSSVMVVKMSKGETD